MERRFQGMPTINHLLTGSLIFLTSCRDSICSMSHEDRPVQGDFPTDSYHLCREPQQHSETPLKEEKEKFKKLAEAVRTILECVGEDPEREGLRATPERYAKAMLYFTKGYFENTHDLVNGAVFHEKYEGLVTLKDIDISSLCEHHMVPFTGKVEIPDSNLENKCSHYKADAYRVHPRWPRFGPLKDGPFG